MLISLRNYSNYSICESNIKIEDLVVFANKNNFNAFGLTDYKLLSGSIEFSIECQKAGIQPIIGIDVDYKSSLDHLTRVTLLSKSKEGAGIDYHVHGLGILCRLSIWSLNISR